MCDLCAGSPSAIDQQYSAIKAKAKKHAKDNKTDVVIYFTGEGEQTYMEAKAFAQHRPGRFYELVTSLEIT